MGDSIIIAARFRGPPNSGNGGYVAGRLAKHFAGAVEVTLRRPTPLERPLALTDGGETMRLLDEDAVIAEARPTPLALDMPAPPTPDAIADLAEVTGFGAGDFGTCFSCGRKRHPPDALCVRPRWISRTPALVAAPWTPHPGLADESGKIPPEFLWAALDCPGGLAVLAGEAASALTGRMHAEVDDDVVPAEPYRIVAWHAGGDGRKRLAGTALFDRHDRLRGRCLATWIIVRPLG